jgi:hypothetical protein
MPGASEKEILARVLTELSATIQASASNLPQPAAALLTTLQDDLSALYPITPHAVTRSPIQQLIPRVQNLTRKLHMPAQPRTDTIPPDTGADQGGQPYPRRLRRYGLSDHNPIRYASCPRMHRPTPRRGQRYIRTNTHTIDDRFDIQ